MSVFFILCPWEYIDSSRVKLLKYCGECCHQALPNVQVILAPAVMRFPSLQTQLNLSLSYSFRDLHLLCSILLRLTANLLIFASHGRLFHCFLSLT